jgi:hypothetical protein
MDSAFIKIANFAAMGAMIGGGMVGGTIGTAATLGTKGIKPKIIGAAMGSVAGAGVGAGGKPKVPSLKGHIGKFG